MGILDHTVGPRDLLRVGAAINAAAYGVLPSASAATNATNLATAVAAAVAAGSSLVLPPGTISFNSTLDLSSLSTVQIVGASREESTGPVSALRYTGATGPAIKLGSSRSVKLAGLKLSYSHASFSGYLIDTTMATLGNTAYLTLEDIHFFSNAGNTATALLCLDGTHDVDLRRCNFLGSQYAIIGKTQPTLTSTGGFAINEKFTSCSFSGQVVASVRDADESWLFDTCVFEPITSGAAAAYKHTSGYGANVTFLNCWMGDDNPEVAGSWITWGSGGGPLLVLGGTIGCNQLTTGITIDTNNCNGISVIGTKFSGNGGSSKAVDFGSTSGHSGVFLVPNSYANVTTQINNPPANAMYATGGGITIDGLTLSGAVAIPGALTAGSATVGATSPNLLSANHATFETSSGSWGNNSNAVISRSTTIFLSGAAALQVTPSGGGSETSTVLITGAVITPGTQYTALASIRTAVAGHTCSFDINWKDSGGANAGTRATSNAVSVTTTGWTQLVATGTAPAGATTASLTIREQTPASAADIFYVDQVSLAPGSSTTWQPPGSLTTVLNGSAVAGQTTGVDLKVNSKGVSQVTLNVEPGSGTTGVALGDGAGNKVFESTATGVKINGGTLATKRLSATATLDFPSISANSSQELTVTVTGAAVGDACFANPSTTLESGLSWNAYVSATNTATIRVNNLTSGAIDPASRTWRCDVW